MAAAGPGPDNLPVKRAASVPGSPGSLAVQVQVGRPSQVAGSDQGRRMPAACRLGVLHSPSLSLHCKLTGKLLSLLLSSHESKSSYCQCDTPLTAVTCGLSDSAEPESESFNASHRHYPLISEALLACLSLPHDHDPGFGLSPSTGPP